MPWSWTGFLADTLPFKSPQPDLVNYFLNYILTRTPAGLPRLACRFHYTVKNNLCKPLIVCLFKTHLFSFIQKWGVWPLFAPLILCLHMGDEERALNSTDAMYRATLLDAVSQCYCIYFPFGPCSILYLLKSSVHSTVLFI